MRRLRSQYAHALLLVGSIAVLLLMGASPARSLTRDYEFNDAHFHFTDNVQEGPGTRDFLSMMGSKAGRVAFVGIPLQQQWSYRVDGDRAPTYYLHSHAPLYYYSFTDAWIAMAYKSLTKEQQARFDAMITGFNPADMYAADHIRRVLQTFPGVFTGIGEFTIHKEFVSAKIPGEVASLEDPALDRILDFAEVALVVLIHCDIDVPFAKEGAEPAYLHQIKALHIVASPEATKTMAGLLQRYPDRFLFGTDGVAPADQSKYLKVFYQYEPLWNSLDADTSRKVRLRN